MIRFGEIKKVLKAHNLRLTDGRIDVLSIFFKHDNALSLKDLKEDLGEFDRVTLYRIVNTFIDHGVLHKIPDDSGQATYGLCHDTCEADGHNHDHMHFKCNECGTIECLDQVIPKVKVPGYKIEAADLILKGRCKSCV